MSPLTMQTKLKTNNHRLQGVRKKLLRSQFNYLGVKLDRGEVIGTISNPHNSTT